MDAPVRRSGNNVIGDANHERVDGLDREHLSIGFSRDWLSKGTAPRLVAEIFCSSQDTLQTTRFVPRREWIARSKGFQEKSLP
jgi:hypothetical protein